MYNWQFTIYKTFCWCCNTVNKYYPSCFTVYTIAIILWSCARLGWFQGKEWTMEGNYCPLLELVLLILRGFLVRFIKWTDSHSVVLGNLPKITNEMSVDTTINLPAFYQFQTTSGIVSMRKLIHAFALCSFLFYIAKYLRG